MSMSEAQKKIRRWFQRHKWHTGVTPTGRGAWLEMPKQKGINYISWPYYKDGTLVPEEKRYRWHNEYVGMLEIDRFDPSKLEISVYKWQEYTAGPNYEEKNKACPTQPETTIFVSYAELKKLCEFMEICIAEEKEKERQRKLHRSGRE